MNIALFDDPDIRPKLLPLTFTRPVAEIRIGILKISEKWQKYFKNVSFKTQDYLSVKYPGETPSEKTIFVNGAVCPTINLVQSIKSLQQGESLWAGEVLIAAYDLINPEVSARIEFQEGFNLIDRVWKIFKLNATEIKSDFQLVTQGRTSQIIDDRHTIVYGMENLFIEEGATIKAATINAENGPIYIGKNVDIQEGAIIKGSHAFCEGATVNIGAKLRGDSTIGPYSKVGGEVSNSVIIGFSNKGHDGFLGNSVLGEWCNLGADTNTSNLKNDYGDVKIWDYKKMGFVSTDEMFCGMIMGDHSKSAINTMFNTGTIVGVCSNIFGPGFPRNFIPSFSWGGAAGFSTYQMQKALEVAGKMMQRRNLILDQKEQSILEHIFNQTAEYRTLEL